jgi:hypothetical protein
MRSSPPHHGKYVLRLYVLLGLTVGEVLQHCRSGRISWADMVLAPSVAGLFKWRQFEPEGDSPGNRLVFALFAFLPRRRGVARLAGPVRRSRDRLEMGPAVCSGTGAALASATQANQRQLGGWTRRTSGSKANEVYLYRAVDSTGATIDFLSRPNAMQRRLSAF